MSSEERRIRREEILNHAIQSILHIEWGNC